MWRAKDILYNHLILNTHPPNWIIFSLIWNIVLWRLYFNDIGSRFDVDRTEERDFFGVAIT